MPRRPRTEARRARAQRKRGYGIKKASRSAPIRERDLERLISTPRRRPAPRGQ